MAAGGAAGAGLKASRALLAGRCGAGSCSPGSRILP